jgi:hypothetical protein
MPLPVFLVKTFLAAAQRQVEIGIRPVFAIHGRLPVVK